MKLPIHFQTFVWKFGNEWVISPHTLLNMLLLIHAGKVKLIHISKRGRWPLGVMIEWGNMAFFSSFVVGHQRRIRTGFGGIHHNFYSRNLCRFIMGTMASQITSLTIVCSTVYSGADQRKHPSFASLAFVRGIHREPVNSPHKWPVTRKMLPFDDVIMQCYQHWSVLKCCIICNQCV